MEMILQHYMNMKSELCSDPMKRDFLEALDASEADRFAMFDTYYLDGAFERALELNE